jgi:hypothetical protein
MSVVTDILSAPFQGLLDGAADIISKFVKDPNAALAAQVQLANLTNQGNMAILQADQAFAASQAQVIAGEEKEGWLAANWRPVLMLTFTTIVANNYLFAPWFHAPMLVLPPDMWDLMKLGITGYVVGRSAEKLIPDAVQSIATVVTGKVPTTIAETVARAPAMVAQIAKVVPIVESAVHPSTEMNPLTNH